MLTRKKVDASIRVRQHETGVDMIVTVYDLVRKTRWLAWSAIAYGLVALWLQWSGEPDGTSVGAFLDRQNNSGQAYNLYFVGFAGAGMVWLAARSSVMASLRKGMTDEQLRKAEPKQAPPVA